MLSWFAEKSERLLLLLFLLVFSSWLVSLGMGVSPRLRLSEKAFFIGISSGLIIGLAACLLRSGYLILEKRSRLDKKLNFFGWSTYKASPIRLMLLFLVIVVGEETLIRGVILLGIHPLVNLVPAVLCSGLFSFLLRLRDRTSLGESFLSFAEGVALGLIYINWWTSLFYLYTARASSFVLQLLWTRFLERAINLGQG